MISEIKEFRKEKEKKKKKKEELFSNHEQNTPLR